MGRKCPRCGLFNPPEAERCDCGFDFEHDTGSAAPLRSIVWLRSTLAIICASPSAVFAAIAIVEWLVPQLWFRHNSRLVASLHASLLQAARGSPITTGAAVWLFIPVMEAAHPVARALIIMLCILSLVGVFLFWVPYLGLIFSM